MKVEADMSGTMSTGSTTGVGTDPHLLGLIGAAFLDIQWSGKISSGVGSSGR